MAGPNITTTVFYLGTSSAFDNWAGTGLTFNPGGAYQVPTEKAVLLVASGQFSYRASDNDPTSGIPAFTSSNVPSAATFGPGYMTVDGVLKYSNGSTWTSISGGSSQGSLDVGPSGDFQTLEAAAAYVNAQPAGSVTTLQITGALTTSAPVKIYNSVILHGQGFNSSQITIGHTGAGIRIANGEWWQAATAYAVNDFVIPAQAWPNQVRFRCTAGGTSGGSAPTWPTTLGDTVTEVGGPTWVAEPYIWYEIDGIAIKHHASATEDCVTIFDVQDGYIGTLAIAGGNANVWGLTYDSCNRNSIDHLRMVDFVQAGVTVSNAMNGARHRSSNWALLPYNWGDCRWGVVDINIKADCIGIGFFGSTTSINVINNVHIDKCEIVGTGQLTDWQVGIWNENCPRIKVGFLDIETINYGIVEISQLGSGQVVSDNEYRLTFIPAGAQTEAKAYCRGAPLQQDHTAGSTDVVIRSGWVSKMGFADGQSLGVIIDDDGRYARTIAASGVLANTPSAGLTTIRFTSALGTFGRTTARNACISRGASYPVRSVMWGKGGNTGIAQFLQGFAQFGEAIGWQDSTTWRQLWARLISVSSNPTLALRGVRGSAVGAIRLNFYQANPLIEPETASETLQIGNPATASGRAAMAHQTRGTLAAGLTGAQTIAATDELVFYSGTGSVALTAAASMAGKVVHVVCTAAGTITFDPNASETINGAATYAWTAPQYGRAILSCDGAAWTVNVIA